MADMLWRLPGKMRMHSGDENVRLGTGMLIRGQTTLLTLIGRCMSNYSIIQINDSSSKDLELRGQRSYQFLFTFSPFLTRCEHFSLLSPKSKIFQLLICHELYGAAANADECHVCSTIEPPNPFSSPNSSQAVCESLSAQRGLADAESEEGTTHALNLDRPEGHQVAK